MDRLSRDLRIALRGLRRAPAFTISAVLILGLAIGMSAAMATVFDAVLLRRLPVSQQDRLAVLWTERDPGVELALDSRDDLALLRQYSRTMAGIAGYAHWGAFAFPLADGDKPLVIPQSR